MFGLDSGNSAFPGEMKNQCFLHRSPDSRSLPRENRHRYPRYGSPLFTFSVLMVILAISCVVSSILLIIGLCTDNKLLLLPWLISLSLSTLLDIVLSIYLVLDAILDPFQGVLFVTDIFICALNVYCLLCVLSQYQEYQAGRCGGPQSPDDSHQSLACQPVTRQSGHKTAPQLATTITDDGSSTSVFLLPPTHRKLSVTPRKSFLYSDLSTISEENSFPEPGRKYSSDVSTLADSQTLSPPSERRLPNVTMTLLSPLPDRHYSFSTARDGTEHVPGKCPSPDGRYLETSLQNDLCVLGTRSVPTAV